jgi:large subunit ribosomal protein L23
MSESSKKVKSAPAKKTEKAAKVSKKVSIAHYDVIQAPIITEKSQSASEFNKVVFRVAPEATKTQVKEAVASIFGVEVLKVNIVNTRGKVKRFKGFLGRRNDVK